MEWILIGMDLLLIISFLTFLYQKYATKGEKRLFILAFLLKVSFGIALGFIYNYKYGGGDTMRYYSEARKMAVYHENQGAAIHDILFNTEDEEEKLWEQLHFTDEPRSMLFVKITFVIYLLAAGNFWLITVFFATLSFTGLWILYRIISTINPNLNTGLIVGFFLWPSTVFWSSGVLKEPIAIFLMCIIIGLVLKYLFFQTGTFWDFLLVLVFAFLLWKLRYFYAAVLYPVLFSYIAAYFFADTFNRMKSSRNKFFVFVTAFAAFLMLATFLHPNLGVNRVFNVMVENYNLYVAKSEPGKYVEFSNLVGKEGVLINMPKAMFSGVFAPNLWNAKDNFWLIIAAIENFIMLCLFLYWLAKAILNRKIQNLAAYSILIYVFVSGTFLAFAAPNFGSLVRYKIGLIPFLVALIFTDARLSHLTLRFLSSVKILPKPKP